MTRERKNGVVLAAGGETHVVGKIRGTVTLEISVRDKGKIIANKSATAGSGWRQDIEST